jgi:predicted NBD/HSP70 family sugar kinase
MISEETGSYLGQGLSSARPIRFDRSPSERLVLSIIRKGGALPSAEIARLAGLSAQSASVITRSLEADGLIVKGDPQRGKVGKPLTPFLLNKDGVYSIGLRIGRRSADMVLLDFCGSVRKRVHSTYSFPTPGKIMEIARTATHTFLSDLGPEGRMRIAGIGVGAPFELWNWLDVTSTPKHEMMAWKEFQFEEAFAEFTDLPIIVGNDSSLACSGEHTFGVGVDHSDFIYFYIGSLMGGGIVLNDRLLTGRNGNAAAFGSLPIRTKDGAWQQLNAHSSVVQLEEAVEARHPGQSLRMLQSDQWTGFDDLLEHWLNHTAESLAYAAITAVAILEVTHVIVDCGAPKAVLADLVDRIGKVMANADSRGIDLPQIAAGQLGPMAGALGAGYQPIVARLLVE